MADEIKKLKKVQLPNEELFEIEALHFIEGSLDTPAQWKSYIDNLAKKGTEIKKEDSLPSLDTDEDKEAAYNEFSGDILLILDATASTPNQYNEYIGITGKTSGSTVDNAITKWELIGTTEIDLSSYVTKGVYQNAATTAGPTVTGLNATFTASGTATVTYSKAVAATVNAGAHSHTVTLSTTPVYNGVKDGGTTQVIATVSLTGEDTAITGLTTSSDSVGISGGSYSSTSKYIKASGTALAASDKTDVIASVSAASTAPVITGISATTQSVITAAIKAVIATATGTSTDGPQYVQSVSGTAPTLTGTTSFMANATVDNNGVLSFGTGSVGISGGSYTSTTKYLKLEGVAADSKQDVIKTVTASGTATAVSGITSTTITVVKNAIKGVSLSSASTTSEGAIKYSEDITGSAPTLTGTTTFLTSATATGSITVASGIIATKATVIKSDGLDTTYVVTGVTVNQDGGHTHTLNYENASASGTASVDVGGHTHSIAQHTHNVDLTD